jgi:glycosyltransferase involved in cell wall biosynthesis
LKKKSKILILASLSSSIINFRGHLLREMVSRGHSVIAVAPADGQSCDVAQKLWEMGVVFETIPLDRGGMNPWHDFQSYHALVSLFRRHKPEVVFAYTAKPVIYGGLAVRKVGAIRFYPMITGLGYAFTQGSGFKRRALRALVQKLYRRSLSSASVTIFQNPDDERLFRMLNIQPKNVTSLRVNGSGVSLTDFLHWSLPEEPIFLMLARLAADKGVREYVDAARLVKRKYPNSVFRLAGGLDSNPSSISEAELQTWVSDGIIEYLGNVTSVHAALANCRFYTLPSYREGTPRSTLEALATGRPVITTDVPGCRETVVHGKNGFLVPPNDPEALAEAMTKMIEMQPADIQKMADASVNLARKKFDVHKVNADILRIMDL